MSFQIDCIKNSQTCIDGKWVISRPLPFYGLFKWKYRIKDALLILKGKAEAVTFYKQ